MLKVILLFALILPAMTFAQDDQNNDIQAMLLLNRAKSKHQYQQGKTPGPGGHEEKLRSYRNSNVATYNQSGGISIGNITPQSGAIGSHSTTVIIQGHIINTK